MSRGQVTVNINGIDYPMSCALGEEAKVIALGAKIDEVARQVAAASGPIGEARILVMAALIMSDKMADFEEKLSQNGLAPDTESAAESESISAVESESISAVESESASMPNDQVDVDKLADMMDGLAARLEKLAPR